MSIAINSRNRFSRNHYNALLEFHVILVLKFPQVKLGHILSRKNHFSLLLSCLFQSFFFSFSFACLFFVELNTIANLNTSEQPFFITRSSLKPFYISEPYSLCNTLPTMTLMLLPVYLYLGLSFLSHA